MKTDKRHIPDLIPLLQDDDEGVARVARIALRELTGKDFGPTTSSSASKAEAVGQWIAWWKEQNAIECWAELDGVVTYSFPASRL